MTTTMGIGEARAFLAIARVFELHALSWERGLAPKERVAHEGHISNLARLSSIEIAHGLHAFVRAHTMSAESAPTTAKCYASMAEAVEKALMPSPTVPILNMHMPPRRTEGIVERNEQGEIVRTVTVAHDI